jgi:hypothetical protein
MRELQKDWYERSSMEFCNKPDPIGISASKFLTFMPDHILPVSTLLLTVKNASPSVLYHATVTALFEVAQKSSHAFSHSTR